MQNDGNSGQNQTKYNVNSSLHSTLSAELHKISAFQTHNKRAVATLASVKLPPRFEVSGSRQVLALSRAKQIRIYARSEKKKNAKKRVTKRRRVPFQVPLPVLDIEPKIKDGNKAQIKYT